MSGHLRAQLDPNSPFSYGQTTPGKRCPLSMQTTLPVPLPQSTWTYTSRRREIPIPSALRYRSWSHQVRSRP